MVLKNMTLVSVIQEDTNHDGLLNESDHELTYLSDLSFKKSVQITPPAVQLLGWDVDSQGEKLYLYVRKDSNKNGKYDNLDERSILFTSTKRPALAQRLLISQ